MKRVLCILVALACLAVLTQVAASAQRVVVDDGWDYTVYGPDGAQTWFDDGEFPQIYIDGATTIDAGSGYAWFGDDGAYLESYEYSGDFESWSSVNLKPTQGVFRVEAGKYVGEGDEWVSDGRGGLDVTTSKVTLTAGDTWVEDEYGGYWELGHGLIIDAENAVTTLSGGTNSTTLVLSDYGAYFDNDLIVDGGLMVDGRISGVADGIDPLDAVNRRQLDGLETSLSAGIASIAALSSIPAPICGKNYSIGVGYGNYNGESAYAVGGKANIPNSGVSIAAGVGFSTSSSPAAAAGVSFSF